MYVKGKYGLRTAIATLICSNVVEKAYSSGMTRDLVKEIIEVNKAVLASLENAI